MASSNQRLYLLIDQHQRPRARRRLRKKIPMPISRLITAWTMKKSLLKMTSFLLKRRRRRNQRQRNSPFRKSNP
jgi:hypothetical protein